MAETQNSDSYLGRVCLSSKSKNLVECFVVVGDVGLELNFPYDVMEAKGLLESGKVFRWYPTEDGSLPKENIEALTEAEQPVIKSDSGSLDNDLDWFFNYPAALKRAEEAERKKQEGN